MCGIPGAHKGVWGLRQSLTISQRYGREGGSDQRLRWDLSRQPEEAKQFVNLDPRLGVGTMMWQLQKKVTS